MNMTLITYRTPTTTYNEYAVVPTSWLSDLHQWLTISESAEILSTDNNYRGDSMLPADWPSYRACINAICISDLLAVGV